jgi:hypothetical protein
VNLKEGTRRLALLLGVAGTILGGFGAYLELQSVLEQRASYAEFERLANSEVVQHERKMMKSESGGRILFKAPDGSERWVPKDEKDAAIRAGGVVVDDGETATLNSGEIKAIHWSNDYRIEEIDTRGSQFLFPTPAPSAWLYCLIVLFPILGFLIPWGAVRAIGWVGAGFAESSK